MTKIVTGLVQTVPTQKNWSMLKIESDNLSSLDKMRIILQRDKIRAAARSQLHKGINGNSIEFYLNKQAAYVGHVSFSAPEGESPLGPIKIVVTVGEGDIHSAIDWLAGKPTRRSEPDEHEKSLNRRK